MKYLYPLVVAVIVGLSALWYVPSMIWGYQVSMATTRGSDVSPERFAELIKGPAPVRWIRGRKEMRAYYDMAQFSKRRTVRVQFERRFDSLLAEGEAAPDPALHLLYAKARAPQLLTTFCAELLVGYASSCLVGEADARLRDGGRVDLSGSLQIVPRFHPGAVADVENGEFIKVYADLALNAAREFTPETRALMSRRAVALCAALRAEFGNCVVGNLQLRTQGRGPDAARTYTMQASAQLVVYADRIRVGKDDVTQVVEDGRRILVSWAQARGRMAHFADLAARIAPWRSTAHF
ncbi:hypothetical protein [Sulfitobacter sp. S190]|uniref:hypothetical protein n=1 Tax=Sulfitobacter sp. S190 TaxID=2867022 RepID=UPI0021A7BFE5|nr:hypothetical protein [Sulfitobacter sp. S190]UWR24554.1 hypothetical protein K3756_18770 [Sulfitobacter sp. S190]